MAAGTANEIEAIAGMYEFREPDEVRVFPNGLVPGLTRIFRERARNVFLETHCGIEERVCA